MDLLITPHHLQARIDSVHDGADAVRLLDVRWRLDHPDGRVDYRAGHLPGAVYVDLETELSAHAGAQEGRHPLPSREVLEAAARRWGIDDGDTVIVYDDAGSMAAARAWWLLTRSGIADVRVLDGGIAAWTAAGLPLDTGDRVPEPGSVELTAVAQGVVEIDGAAAWPSRGILLDARAAERYRGEIEPLDPVAGHIPGARNLPSAAYLREGRFMAPADIRAAFAAVGAVEGVAVAAYCGSGVTAAQAALAGALAGIDVTVYPGSWSQWANTPGRQVATGALP